MVTTADSALFLGHAAMVDEDFEVAFKHYTSAIEPDPNDADCYSKRSAADLKRSRFSDAMSDATASVKLAPTAKAYQRKGIACFNLGEFSSARNAFSQALELDGDGGSRELKRWVRKCDAEILLAASSAASPAALPVPSNTTAPTVGPPSSSTAAAATVDPNKIRHEWSYSPQPFPCNFTRI